MSWLTPVKKKTGQISFFEYRWRDRGHRRSKSTGTADYTLALRIQKKWDALLTSHGSDALDDKCADNQDLSIENQIRQYLRYKIAEKDIKESTLKRYEQHAKYLLEYFGCRHVTFFEQLNPMLLRDYKATRLEAGRSMKTVFEELSLLKAIIGRLVDDEALERNPVKATAWPEFKKIIPAKPERIGHYTLDQATALLNYFQQHRDKTIYDFILAAFCTGARLGELMDLRAGDIDLACNAISIRNKKTERGADDMFRVIPIHAELKSALIHRLQNRLPAAYLFDDVRAHAINYVRKHLYRACKKLNIQYKRAHGTRHSFTTLLLDLNAPLTQVSNSLGHKHLSTTAIYAHRQPIAEAKLNELHFVLQGKVSGAK